MTMRLPFTFMAPPSSAASAISSFGCSGCAMLWQFWKCSSAEAATKASLLKAKQGPCKAFMALTDSFPSRRAVSRNFNVVVTRRVAPWSRSVGVFNPTQGYHKEEPPPETCQKADVFPLLESLALDRNFFTCGLCTGCTPETKLKGAGHKAHRKAQLHSHHFPPKL